MCWHVYAYFLSLSLLYWLSSSLTLLLLVCGCNFLALHFLYRIQTPIQQLIPVKNMANTMNMNIKNVSFFDVLPVKMNKAASPAKRTAAMMNMTVTDVLEYLLGSAIFVACLYKNWLYKQRNSKHALLSRDKSCIIHL